MIYRILFTALMLVVPLIGFSQSNNWLSTVDLNVSVSSSDHIDLYTDQEGNHVIVHKSNQLTYYLFSATGSQIRTSTIDNFSESPRLSRIIGHGENLYISYKKGSTIKTEKSTDSGATWSTTDVDDIALSNNQVNGLEVWTDANGLHLVHSEWNDNDLVYNSFYQRVPHNNNEWTDFKQVTDETNVAGGFPSVTTSSNRVHVAFTDSEGSIPGDGAGDPRSRDRSSSTWQSSYLITSPDDPAYCSIIANNSKLHAFYYIPDPLVHILKHRTRSLSGGSWSATEITLESGANAFEPIDMAVSADDQVHIFYNDGSGQYNVWNNTTNWGSEFTPTSTGNVYSQRIAANSNDIYVIWNNTSTIKLRQRDFAPLAPTNLSRSIADPYGDRHPRIDWDANAEADLDEYEVWKKKGSGTWNLLATTSQTYYVDNSETGVSLYPYSNNVEIDYKLKAVDLQNNKSGYSETVTFNQRGGGFDKPGQDDPLLANNEVIPEQYQLAQNYPNPFNPSTTISFALPEAQPTELRIYSMNGKEVITLVDQFLEAGIYHIQWDGRDADGQTVASGIYIYRLKSGQQRFTKKMMLIK